MEAFFRSLILITTMMYFYFPTWLAACCISIAFCRSFPLSADGLHRGLDARAEDLVSLTCLLLKIGLGDKVLFPNDAAYNEYQAGALGYWTQQEAALSPACRILPTCSEDVAFTMAILVTHACKFAVRGGGHMSWAGAANIDASGVTIDLSAMKQVEVSDDRTITSVGGGARWEDVYLKLDALDLAVSGGRVAAVGVGGLITGGGNSFFASRYGFACDNVQNFEVVLASGKIVNANIHEHRGLYRALKGGTNNFGIVTRFDLQTFSQGKLWGGMIYNPIESAALQFQYLEDFTTASGNGVDDHASIINAYIFTAAGPSLVANQFTYTKPEPFPSILCNFTDLQPQMSNTLRTTNLTNLTIELGQGTPNGLRQQFGTATFSNNATLFAHIFALATEIFEPIQSIDNFLASFVLQPISKAITSRAHLTGGNSLGISAQDGNLVWLDLTLQWSSPTDDAAVTNATQTLLRCATAYAKAQGLHHDFLYLNYALQTQDPIAGYGSESVAHLRNMSGLYDPSGVFQRLVPGGFKLWREDVGCCG